MEGLKKRRGAKAWKVILLCLADAVTYFLSAMSGSISIFIVYQFTSQATATLKDQVGSILLIFLVLYGILGVTGKLPELLNKIKIPGTG
jgi:4-hydroxybenzoate polyprenyltransferase